MSQSPVNVEGGQLDTGWSPNFLDKYKFGHAYVRYAAGVAMLNDPKRLKDLHARELTKKNQRDELIIHAQTLIWAGFNDLIRYANPPEYRTPFSETEKRHEETLPVMIKMVDEAVKQERDQLNHLNPMFAAMKPLPLVAESIYKYVAHGRKDKVYLYTAMDAFAVNPVFGEIGEQTFKGVPRITIASRDISLKLAS